MNVNLLKTFFFSKSHLGCHPINTSSSSLDKTTNIIEPVQGWWERGSQLQFQEFVPFLSREGEALCSGKKPCGTFGWVCFERLSNWSSKRLCNDPSIAPGSGELANQRCVPRTRLGMQDNLKMHKLLL